MCSRYSKHKHKRAGRQTRPYRNLFSVVLAALRILVLYNFQNLQYRRQNRAGVFVYELETEHSLSTVSQHHHHQSR